MRIVHYLMNVRLRDGGVVRAVLDLCSLLAGAGEEVTLLCSVDTDLPPAWVAGGPGVPRVVRLGSSVVGGLLPRAAMRRALDIVSESDIVHFHGMWEISNYQLAGACRRAGKPYIYSPHGMLDDWAMTIHGPKKRVALRLTGRRVLEQARYVHFAAAGEFEDSRKRIGNARGRVVPLVFDWSQYTALPGPELAQRTWPEVGGGVPVVLFLSRLVENKGPGLVIDAAGLLRSKGTPLRLVIAGDGKPGYVAALRRRAAQAGVSDATTFTGHVNGAAKVSLYQASSVFVLPTIHENFGFATIEALACGCPAVTTPGNMLKDELSRSGGATVVPRTVGAVAAAIEETIGSAEGARERGERGRAWVGDYLRPSAVLEEYRALYA